MIAPLAAAVLAATMVTAPAPAADHAPKCRDRIANILADAGFTGRDRREAWAIVMRESNGQNLGPGHPSFNGADYGIWQINAPAHSGAPWWSVDAMLDPVRQSRIVYKWSRGGDNWQPWGLTPDGQLDASQYGGWSAWQQQEWIIGPFRYWFARYPKACR